MQGRCWVPKHLFPGWEQPWGLVALDVVMQPAPIPCRGGGEAAAMTLSLLFLGTLGILQHLEGKCHVLGGFLLLLLMPENIPLLVGSERTLSATSVCSSKVPEV